MGASASVSRSASVESMSGAKEREGIITVRRERARGREGRRERGTRDAIPIRSVGARASCGHSRGAVAIARAVRAADERERRTNPARASVSTQVSTSARAGDAETRAEADHRAELEAIDAIPEVRAMRTLDRAPRRADRAIPRASLARLD